jgi:hypothetical protein
MIRKFLAFGYQCTGADETARANASSIKYGRAHSDERSVADLAPVQDSMMTNSHIFPNYHWEAGIGVKHGAFLHVASRTDLDWFVVATQYRAEPDASVDP